MLKFCRVFGKGMHPGLAIAKLTLALCLGFATAAVQAESFRVVVPKSAGLQKLDTHQVSDIFMGRVNASRRVRPVDQKDEGLRADFYQHIAGKSLSSVKAYWAKRVFTGRGRPPAMMTLEETRSLFAEDAGIITYLPASVNVPDDYMSVYEFEVGDGR